MNQLYLINGNIQTIGIVLKRENGFNYLKNAKAISLSMSFRERTYTSYYYLHHQEFNPKP